MHTKGSAVHLPQRVGHASLVSQETSEVDRLAWIILGPRTHPAPMLLATLVGQEPHVSMAGCMEFAMRLEKDMRDETTWKCNQVCYNDFHNNTTKIAGVAQEEVQ